MDRPIPVVLDCDPGHDDAIAILLAVQSPRIDLRAVTTTFGNCAVEDATRNALRVLELAGAPQVPVAVGAAGPLTGAAELGNYVHGRSGLDGPDLPEPVTRPVTQSAVDLMGEVLTAAEEPVTLVATGPITNVARLLQGAPGVRDRIREVIFMGGSTERGNHTPTAEFNAYSDPEALEVVLEAGVRPRMVGLNLTHQALATADVVDRLRAMDHRLGRVAAGWMGFFGSSYRQVWQFDSPPVHDPCTLAALIDPHLVRWQEAFVAVETAGRWTRGTTVVDLFGRLGRPANAEVAMTLDVRGYWELVLGSIDALGRQERPGEASA
ncbi:nucleoside hydrolase [Georgenia sp. SYP-B2076]|uniref:nucleoside hydrolase n=1 Tax=Georgenia sp. SYP-B2076 TaxID=2495881 RepID=UPI000F8C4B2C|nr:nucleoside hydrolase [Georgenia sp. SYP-B2076]